MAAKYLSMPLIYWLWQQQSDLVIRWITENCIFLFLNQNIYFGYSEEPTQ